MSNKLKLWTITALALLLSTWVNWMLIPIVGAEAVSQLGFIFGILCLILHLELEDYFDL